MKDFNVKTYQPKHLDLSAVSLKTLLLYPPGFSQYLFYPDNFPPLGLPQLHGFLRHARHYSGVKVIDLNLLQHSSSKLRLRNYYFQHIRYSQALNTLLSTKVFNRSLRDFQEPLKKLIPCVFTERKGYHGLDPLSGLSLHELIDSALAWRGEDHAAHQYVATHIEPGHDHLVGFSVLYPKQLYHALILAKLLKTSHPNVFVIMGGSLITKYLQDLTSRKDIETSVDGFIENDGEEPLAELIYQLEHSRDFDEVPNFYFRQEKAGYTKSRVTFHAEASYLCEPIFDGFSSYSLLPIQTSYGCPWGRCSYCSYKLHHSCSIGDVERIIRIIKNLHQRYHISSFRLIDDCLSLGFLKHFSEALLRERLTIQWSSFMALFPGLNRSLIELMARSGCHQINIGLESMSPRILKLMGKPHTPEHAETMIQIFHEFGISMYIYIVFGFPTETKEEASVTLKYLQKNRKLFSGITIQPFALERGTAIFNSPQQYGITKIYTEDRHGAGVGARMGYRYDVCCGMSQQESKAFTEDIVLNAGIN